MLAPVPRQRCVRLAVAGCVLGFLPAGPAVAITYDFTQTFGTIDVVGSLTYAGSVPAALTVGDLNANATWSLTFMGRRAGAPVYPYILTEGDSSWATELLDGTSLTISATADELVFELATPPETNAAVVLMSDSPTDFRQFRLVEINQPGLKENQVIIQADAVPGPSADFAPLPYDTNLRFPVLAAPPLDYFTLAACRVIDTRNPAGPLGGPALAAGADRTFPLAGACGIPATAKSLAVGITVLGPAAAGRVCLHPGPGVSLFACTVYGAGQTRANNTVATLGDLGELSVFADQSAGTVHFLLDVHGYFE